MAALSRMYTLEEIAELSAPVFKKHGVEWARVFGSYARGDQSARSDLDILVKSNPRGLKFGGLLADLFDIFGYGTVDLYDEQELLPGTNFTETVLREGVLIYGT